MNRPVARASDFSQISPLAQEIVGAIYSADKVGFDEYQQKAATTAKYERSFIGMPNSVYTALGLCGEAGEVAEKIKKFHRDGGTTEDVRPAIKKELGDVLWYLSETARQWGLTLSEVAEANLAKLADRNNRGVVSGSGDDR